jgi:hypothetical protein
MTLPTQPVAFQAPGQGPENASPQVESQQGAPVEGEQEQGKATPEYLTKEEFEARLEAALSDRFKRVQSFVDKSNDTVLKKVQADLQAITTAFDLQRKAGMAVTAEQENAAKQQVLMKALSEGGSVVEKPEPATAAGQPPAQGRPAPAEPAVDPITAEALNMMRTAGVEIEDGDPEIALIKQDSPYAFLKSIETAIAAKRERLNVPPENLIPGVGGGVKHANPNPIANVNNPDKLLKMAFGG